MKTTRTLFRILTNPLRVAAHGIDQSIIVKDEQEATQVQYGMRVGFQEGLETAAIRAFCRAMAEIDDVGSLSRSQIANIANIVVGGETFELHHDGIQCAIPWEDERFVRAIVREIRQRAEVAMAVEGVVR